MKRLSKANLLLEAAQTLPQPFSWEDLVVRAWEKHSEAFGLKGYRALYPDSNRVSATLYGALGLLGRGLIERHGLQRFRVVPTHMAEVRKVV